MRTLEVFWGDPMRNVVFLARRGSELEIWRGPARSTLQFSRTALHRSGRSAYFSGFGGVRFATFGQSPCLRPGPGLGSAPRATPVSDVSMGISVRRCALLGERSALMPMLTSDPRSSVRAPSDASFDPVSDVSMGISVRRCALLGERSALMPMLTSDPRSSVLMRFEHQIP